MASNNLEPRILRIYAAGNTIFKVDNVMAAII